MGILSYAGQQIQYSVTQNMFPHFPHTKTIALVTCDEIVNS